ncbi:MAG TPA: hypothetical protein VHV82_08410 [Sporichthyaceae bacterium]|nr:hypothetical protein [Sporichthyaceae bacterium]
MAFGAVNPNDPALLISGMAVDLNATRVGVAGGVRPHRDHPPGRPGPRRPVHRPPRRLCTAGAERPDRWLAVTCSALPPGVGEPALSKRWVELFDAIMNTFRWTKLRA